MDKQEFIAIHRQNVESIEWLKAAIYSGWVMDKKPTEPSERSKKMWIVISGAIERCNKAVQEENKIYMDAMRKRLLK